MFISVLLTDSHFLFRHPLMKHFHMFSTRYIRSSC
nr:MAG TPA: hypothetical protein [Caudoviricetes sp.]